MFYVKLNEDGTVDRYPYTLTDLKRDNRNTSFPRQIDNETAASFGVLPVQSTTPPPYEHTINLERTAEKQGEIWVEVWVENPATQEEIDQRVEANSRGVREQRNQLLAETDWTQLADVNLTESKKAEWTTYRQSLRDITEQNNFPWEITWPIKPE